MQIVEETIIEGVTGEGPKAEEKIVTPILFFFLSTSSAYPLAAFYDPLEGSGNQTKKDHPWKIFSQSMAVLTVSLLALRH